MANFNTVKLITHYDKSLICYGTSNGKIGFCDLDGNRIKGLKEFKAFSTEVNDIKTSKNGHKILSVGSDKNSDGFLYTSKAKLFDLSGNIISEFKHGGQPQTCLFSSDEEFIYIACFSGEVAIFKMDGSFVKVFQAVEQEYATNGCVLGFDLSPNGMFLVTTGQKKAKLWTIDGSLVKELQVNQHYPKNSYFSPDGNLIAVDEFVEVVNIYKMTGEQVTKIQAYNRGGISGMSFSHDSKNILVCNQMINTKIFDIPGNLCAEYATDEDTIQGVFSKDSQTIYTVSFKSLQKIDRKTGTITTIRTIK